MFVKFVSNDYVEFKRNPNYWRKDTPKWERLIFKVVPEDAVRVALPADEPGAGDHRTAAARVRSLCRKFPGIEGGTKPSYGLMMLTMNLARPPMDDVNFRFAVSKAINREEVAELFNGIFEPHAAFTFAGRGPGLPYNWDADKLLNYDLDAAREYLAKSGYPDGADFELVIPAVPYIVNVAEAALLVQSQLAKIGINARIQTLQMRSYFKKAFGKDKTSNLPRVHEPAVHHLRAGRAVQVGPPHPESQEFLEAVSGDESGVRRDPGQGLGLEDVRRGRIRTSGACNG